MTIYTDPAKIADRTKIVLRRAHDAFCAGQVAGADIADMIDAETIMLVGARDPRGYARQISAVRDAIHGATGSGWTYSDISAWFAAASDIEIALAFGAAAAAAG